MLPKAGTTIGGKYALEAVIGRGGMGAVYRAKNLLTGRRVALKWILPTLNGADEMRARLFREARAMGRIEHPNVCAVYDVGQDGDAIYLVMELLAGRSLRALMEERRLAVPEVAEILLEGMQGVSAAHAAGVVHRDLKPDNLFVCFDDDGTRGTTKVLDFGVSKILDLAESDGLTKSGMAVGTPHYMSPEQIIGAKDVDARSDVYGLGAILYQALAGRLPFEADNYSALVVQIATCSPEPLENHADDEGKKLATLVHRAIARKPSERFQTVAEMALALEPFAGGVRFETPKPRPRSLPPPPSDETALPASGSEPIGVSLTASPSIDRDLVPTRVPGGAHASGEHREDRSSQRTSMAETAPAHASGAERRESETSSAPAASGAASSSRSVSSREDSASSRSSQPSSSVFGAGTWIAIGAVAIVLAIAIGTLASGGTPPAPAPAPSSASATVTTPDSISPSATTTEHPSRRSEVASALTPGPIALHAVTSTPPAPVTTSAPGVASAQEPSSEPRRDRLGPQAPQTRTRVRVVDLPAEDAEPSMTEPATAPAEEPAGGSSDGMGEVMTATGRSGTISTSDFE